MIALTWNCRGIGHPETIRHLRGIIHYHRPDVIILSETKCNNLDYVQGFFNSVGFYNSKLVPSKKKVGGLMLLWNSKCDI